MFARIFTPLRIALLIGIALSVVRFNNSQFFYLSDIRAMDFRLLQRGRIDPGNEVVIVAVDDDSVTRVGRWPWPRTIFAQLIDRIAAERPLAIGVDVTFSEPSSFDESSGRNAKPNGVTPEAWETVQAALRLQDEALVESIRRAKRVVLGYFVQRGLGQPTQVDPHVSTYNLVQGKDGGRGVLEIPNAEQAHAGLPKMTTAAHGLGYFNVIPDDGDGFVRRLPLAIRYGDTFIQPLSLATLRAALGDPMLRLRLNPFGAEAAQLASVQIPLAEDGQLLINYRGPSHTFRHVPAVDVLDGRAAPDALAGKIVLIGVTATAVADVRVTAFSEIFPGVEIHANVIDNILRGDFIRQPRWLVAVDIGAILLFSLFLGFVLSRLRGARGAIAAIAALALYLVGSQHIFVRYGLPLSLVYPILAIVGTYTGIVLFQYVIEEREKRKVRRALALYLSPSMAELVSAHPERLALGGEKRDLTVFFSDIRGFTSMSEKLAPEELVELLNQYLGAMTDIIFEYDGMLDKYIGDAVMAVWGAPLAQPDHARRACLATIAMTRKLDELNRGWQQRGWPRLDIGCGLNTGPMVFGNMGSSQHLALTVMGDNVNLGSRLEGTNKMYGTRIIASESTVQAAGDVIVARELDLVRVKGRHEPVRMFEVLGAADDRARLQARADDFERALRAYRQRRWDEAEAMFEAMANEGDAPAALYAERCRTFAIDPPGDDWNGVTVLESK